jgi:RND family efflux transporter MFP subunit
MTEFVNHPAPTLRVAVLIAAAVLGMVSCSGRGGHRPLERPIAVRVVTPQIGNIADRLPYVGTIRGRREVRVNAQIQGTVADLPRAEGERARAGAVVATLDAPEIAATVERLRADRDYWCAHHDTDARLVAAGALPEEQARTSLRACRSARAALAEAEARLARTVERAPVDGRVLEWLVEPGQHVLPGQPLLLLGDDSMEVHVEVVEEDIIRGIDVGTPVAIRTAAGQTLQSRVSEVAPVTTGPSRTFTVKAPVPAAASPRFGASVRVDFVLTSCSRCITVPVEAIHRAGAQSYVYLIRDGRALRQSVDTGITQEGRVQVSLLWNGNDAIAVSNVSALTDSAAVFAVSMEGMQP